jgi:hypothetical protein
MNIGAKATGNATISVRVIHADGTITDHGIVATLRKRNGILARLKRCYFGILDYFHKRG